MAMGRGHLVLPDQLFQEQVPACRGGKAVLLEHPSFFQDAGKGIRPHKKKLILHRASMTEFGDQLESQGIPHLRLEFREIFRQGIMEALQDENLTELSIFTPSDSRVLASIRDEASDLRIPLRIEHDPTFIMSEDRVASVLGERKHLSLTSMYIAERKRTGILIERGRPEGNRWTLDTSNRKNLPKGIDVPTLPVLHGRESVTEAIGYVERGFHDHPGSCSGFNYPVTREESIAWLNDFLEKRFSLFGDYQDAMSTSHSTLFHSVISPSLNIGLLSPGEVVESAVHQVEVSLNSREGFVRQLMGWREFVRGVYILHGERQRSSNFWGINRALPPFFYGGDSGIVPLDLVVKRVLETGYAHHIERLMVLGNIMLLMEIRPSEVYRWFMEMFVDAYDWVMVPNVFGMSQFADGGLMSTKPYISSSNYLMRMGDFERGDWCDIWDALFWRFIHSHREAIGRYARMNLMLKMLDRMPPSKIESHLDLAEDYLEAL